MPQDRHGLLPCPRPFATCSEERFGVREYWLMDPEHKAMTFLRLGQGRFVEVPPERNAFISEAIPGFTLDLGPVRESFKPW